MKSLSVCLEILKPSPSKRPSWRLLAWAFAVALLASGCQVSQTVLFNEADFKPYESSGTAAIRGHAFVRTPNGFKHGAAGLKISLVPLTAYTAERAKIMEAQKTPAPADPRLDGYLKTAIGDWGGAYKFENLPAGDYLLYCKVEWSGPQGGGDYYAIARTHLSNGEHKEVVIANVDAK